MLKCENPQFSAHPSEKDMLTWHFVIFNLPHDCPYAGGLYHGKLIFPREYPLKPPAIMMLTPSGRFEVNTRICLSMSDFHPETWNPSWRVETIIVGVISFMLDEAEPSTVGGIQSSVQLRKREALLSYFRNLRNHDFVNMFPDFTDSRKYIVGRGFFRITLPGTKSLADLNVHMDDLKLVNVRKFAALKADVLGYRRHSGGRTIAAAATRSKTREYLFISGRFKTNHYSWGPSDRRNDLQFTQIDREIPCFYSILYGYFFLHPRQTVSY